MWFAVLYCAPRIAKWELSKEESSLGAVQGCAPDLVNYVKQIHYFSSEIIALHVIWQLS